MANDEWILKMVNSLSGKRTYMLVHECSPHNYSSTITLNDIVNGQEKVVGRVCFSCRKEAPAYKNSIIELSK